MGNFRRVAVSQESLARIQDVLPTGWKVQRHWTTAPDWYNPDSPDVVEASNGQHSLVMPDPETIERMSSGGAQRFPNTRNPLYTSWNPMQHGSTIHEILSSLDSRKLAHPRSIILAPWYRQERFLGPRGSEALGYTVEHAGNKMMVRTPLSFVSNFVRALKSTDGPNYERGMGPAHDLVRRFDLKSSHPELLGVSHLDDINPSLFQHLNRIAFSTGESFHNSDNHFPMFSGQPEGTHITGAPAVDDTVKHEEGHTDFYKNFNADLPDHSTAWPVESPYRLHDLFDELSQHFHEQKQNGSLWSRMSRFSPTHQRFAPHFDSNENYGANLSPESLTNDYKADPKLYLHSQLPQVLSERNPQNSRASWGSGLTDAIMNASLSHKSAENLQELYATHYNAWMSPCSPVDSFTRRLAKRFNWSDPHGKMG